MDVEFDPAKDAINIAKHGLSLAEATAFEMAGAVVEPDERYDYGEPRFRAFGRVDGDARCLVFTILGNTVRVISYRHAHAKESAVMASKHRPVVFDDDNPEWTEEDFARARPATEVLPPEVIAAFGKKRGRPVGSLTSNKQRVTIRLDRDALDRLRAQGPGWQTRINEAVRKAAGL